MNFQRYISFKLGQHERAMTRARQCRARRPDMHAYYLGQARVIREVLAADLRDDRVLQTEGERA